MRKKYDLISALQKSIRWCDVNASRYFAHRLVEIGLPGAIFNRLIVIAAEDVGLADPTLVDFEIDCLKEFESLLKVNSTKKRDVVYVPALCEIVDRAVIAAALCYKSRLLPMLSFVTLYDIYRSEDFSGNMFDYFNQLVDALKNHNEKTAIHHAYVLGIYLDQMQRVLNIIRKLSPKRNEYLINGWLNGFNRHNELLLLAGSVLLLCRDLNYHHGEYKHLIGGYLSTPIKPVEIPDRAYDQHTSIGKKRGRGLKHFFNEGASVKNERFPNDWEMAGRRAYLLADHEGLGKSAKVIDATKTKLRAPVALVTI